MSERAILEKNIKRYRKFKGLTQGELAKKVGLTKDTISKIELGKQENLGMKYLILIQEELDVTMGELFTENPEEKVIKFVISDKNFESLEKLLGRR